MEIEYYKILIQVLSYIVETPKPKILHIERMAGDFWLSIRAYLKDNGIVEFASGDSLFEIRKTTAGKYLDKARIELERIEDAKSDRWLDRISKRISIVISIAAFIVSLISLYFSLR